MKVAILLPNLFTDAMWTDGRPNKEARALLQAGHDVVILATGKYGQRPPTEETKDGLRIIRRPTLLHWLYVWLKRPSENRQQGDRNRQVYYEKDTTGLRGWLTRRVLQALYDLHNFLFCVSILRQAVLQKADVYQGMGLPGLLPAFLASRLTGARLIYDSRELWTEQLRSVPYGPWHKKLMCWLEKSMCRRCDLVVAVSHASAETLTACYGIPLPLEIPNVHPFSIRVPPSAAVRARLATPDRPVAIYVGYLNLGRGLEQLIDAAEYLEGVDVALIGDGVLRCALEKRIQDKHLSDRVRLIGWVPSEELPAYIAAADVGVAPTQRTCLNYYCTLDNKIFYYIMAAIPVAMSDHPEKRRLIEQYGIGATFDESDPRDIARVINGLLADPVAYQAMRARCERVGREELNWEVVSRRYVAAVEALASGSSPSP